MRADELTRATGWALTTMTVLCGWGATFAERVDVDAWTHPDMPGLAVNEARNRLGYNVSHTASGLAACKNLPTLRAAMVTCERLWAATGGGWERTIDEMDTDPQWAQAAHAFVNADREARGLGAANTTLADAKRYVAAAAEGQ